MIEVSPASVDQVIRGRNGKLVLISAEENHIAAQLEELSKDLRFPLKLRYNDTGEFWVVYQILDDGQEHLVTTAQECDQRLVEKIRRVTHPSYDYGAEMDRLDREADRIKDYQFNEQVGEISERLAHAVRQDLRKARPGPVYIPSDIAPYRGPIYIPRDINGTSKEKCHEETDNAESEGPAV